MSIKIQTVLFVIASIGMLQVFACIPLDRFRRQIADLKAQQQQQQQPSVMSFLSDLKPQLDSAKMLTSLFSDLSQPTREQQLTSQLQSAFQQPTQSPLGALGSQPSQILSQLSQLSNLVRAAQDGGTMAMASTQQQVQQAAQPVQQAVQGAQGGLQSTLTEIGQGLQRIATNNPSLIPDVKAFYQTVSAKLSNSGAQAAPAAAKLAGDQTPSIANPLQAYATAK